MDNASQPAGGPLAFPIAEGFRRLGVKPTKGFELIKPGPNGEAPQLETFTIGRCRYVTQTELQRFIQARIEASRNEDRATKVASAVAGRARQRAEQAPAGG